MSLKKNDIGCQVGSNFCGAFGYAEDIMLLSPSVSGLHNMLDCCSEFASTYLLINLSKPFFDTTVGPRPNLARMCG